MKCLESGTLLSEETFTYDAAGNITDAPDSCFQYDTNNRLVVFNNNAVSYDMDGNMLNNGVQCFTYDSANRLVSADGHTYTYNAEDVRIRNLCEDEDTTYTYDTNCKLSKLLCKTTNGVTTKYVYGRGLIGEEVGNTFKTYHFDCRGSTIAITDASGNITDTFKYDTYGKMTEHIGNSSVIFGYNGRDGVVTDKNGLIYMRARYYSPEMKRFVNADIVAGEISNAVTLNRFAYANGNPVSFVDPFGLSVERGQGPSALEAAYMADHIYSATRDDIGVILGDKFNDWKLYDILINDDGIRMGVYRRYNANGVAEYAVVNKGTTVDNLIDWANNLAQPFGLSPAMHKSISEAKKFVNEHKDANITFIGHSKGGGEALANAKATNRDAIVFNPAIPNYDIYGLGDSIYTAKAISYVIPGEILSDVYIATEVVALNPYTPLTPWLLDDFIALVSRPVVAHVPFWETKPLFSESLNPLTNHDIVTVIDILDEKQ